jgi:hypothetical protein
MSEETVQPRDAKETSILSLSAKIAGLMAVLGTLITGILASVQGTEWITANLPALLSGLTTLIGGGVATGIAVRRMMIDKAANIHLTEVPPLLKKPAKGLPEVRSWE